LTDEEFWALIGLLDGVADERSVARLAARLDDRAEHFQQRLDSAVRDLDASRLDRLPINDVSDPADADGVPLIGTALESFLLAVVAAGPDVYNAVRADPAAATTRRWSFSEADRLGRTYEQISGPAGWCRPLVYGSGEHWLPYADAVLEITMALDTREDWRSWWAASGRERLDLVIELSDEDTGIVRRRGRLVRADFRLPLQRLLHRSPGVAARIAAEDLTRILKLVGEKLALAVPPALPWPANAEPEDPRRAGSAARLIELRRKFR
jgi:hypothetical protein